jgi:hypothetical protein
MAVTTQQPNNAGSGVRHAPDAWAHPQDPEENTKPPGNGELDAEEPSRSEEKLLAVLGS